MSLSATSKHSLDTSILNKHQTLNLNTTIYSIYQVAITWNPDHEILSPFNRWLKDVPACHKQKFDSTLFQNCHLRLKVLSHLEKEKEKKKNLSKLVVAASMLWESKYKPVTVSSDR